MTEWKARQVIDGVTLETGSRWWGRARNVTGTSAFAVPERMILFASQRGMEHGFWRDLEVGDAAFDARFFVFSDQPALLPIICGEATRRALSADDLVLYVRDNLVTTTSRASEVAALDRHVAVHRALAEDHRAFLAEWKQRMESAAGRADAVWPPTATLLRPSGALLVRLAWTAPRTRDGADWSAAAASMRTEVTAHDDRPHERVRWSLAEVPATQPCTHVLAKRRFVLAGALPFPLAQLEGIVRQGDLASIAVHANRITVGVHGIARAQQIDAAVRIIHLVIDATAESSSPYR